MRADASATPTPATLKSQHEMTVCNACRYCESYCPVFQAMEERLTFSSGDIAYLANLCHNCGECLYACQYAPPHEFGIDVPRTFSALRVESYEAAAWPAFAAGLFRSPWGTVLVALVIAAIVVTELAGRSASGRGDFYSAIPHAVMVTIFGIAALFAVVALTVGYRRFAVLVLADPNRLRASSVVGSEGARRGGKVDAARDVFRLTHLHTTGQDCTDAEETRRPWRRWMHHCTFYGFLLCAASTSVAAIYHLFGWLAPYDYTSVPVVLGTAGGLALLIGTTGLFLVDRGRDPDLTHHAERWLDDAFLAMLFATSVTGLVLLALREGAWMRELLIVHLAFVLALFVTIPYGKFVHGIYRAAALVKFRRETKHEVTKTI